jgi:guanylate kinase
LGIVLAAHGWYCIQVPYTTRVPKEGEVDGVDYHFVSREAFQAMIDGREVVEFGEVNGMLYGTRRLKQDDVSQVDTKPIARKQKFRRSRAQAQASPTVSPPKKVVVEHPGSFAVRRIAIAHC